MSEDPTGASPEAGQGGGEGHRFPEAIVRSRSLPSIVWLIPLVAAVVGLYLAYVAWSEAGPTIRISFETAEGLVAGQTKLKYKDVEFGVVDSVELTDDLSHVVVTANLVNGISRYLTENTRFWVVRAQVSAGQVTGLETVFSGVYIAVDPSDEGEPQRSFEGLEKAPVVTSDKPGTVFQLRAEELGSVEVGSPVYYRWLNVGQVAAYELSESGEFVSVQVFIEAPHDQRVRSTTRFWNASGLDATLSAEGVQVDSPSLITMLVGGIAFETPATVTVARDVPQNMVFELYPNKQATNRPRYSLKSRFLLYFEDSVAGLVAGSPVEFRGIKIGQVLDVDLILDPETGDIRIPVIIEIEPERMGLGEDSIEEEGFERVQTMVANGFRGSVATGNFLTGQKKVDFNFFPDAEPAEVVLGEAYPILPTSSGGFDAIAERVGRIVDKVDRIPLESIGANLDSALGSLATTLEEVKELAGTANSEVMPGLAASMGKLEETLTSADTLIAPDSPVAQELEALMIELAEAARSIRVLAERLEEHPEELLRGKTE